jgi:hypothetical protein
MMGTFRMHKQTASQAIASGGKHLKDRRSAANLASIFMAHTGEYSK